MSNRGLFFTYFSTLKNATTTRLKKRTVQQNVLVFLTLRTHDRACVAGVNVSVSSAHVISFRFFSFSFCSHFKSLYIYRRHCCSFCFIIIIVFYYSVRRVYNTGVHAHRCGNCTSSCRVHIITVVAVRACTTIRRRRVCFYFIFFNSLFTRFSCARVGSTRHVARVRCQAIRKSTRPLSYTNT
jgi:hypothetical protein